MKLATILSIGISLVLAVGLLAIGFSAFRSRASETISNESIPMVTVDVIVAEKTQKWESKAQFTGVVKAKNRSQLSFERLGRVEEILVEQGDRIEAGQSLAFLNQDQINAQIRKLKADRLAAEAQLDEMIAGPRTEVIEAAQASVVELDSQLELAQQVHKRRQRLLAIGGVSQEEAEQAANAIEKLLAARTVAQKTLDDLKLGTRKEKIAMQKASIEGLDELILASKIELRNGELKAPYSGFIVERNVHPGVVVQPGHPVFVISSSHDLEAQFGIPPSLVTSMVVGQELDLKVRGGKLTARLKSINPQIDDETRTMKVIVAINPSSGNEVFPGDLVELDVTRVQPVEGFWLPLTSVSQGARGLWECMTVDNLGEDGQGTIAIKHLEILHVESDRALVRGTLSDNELVVATATSRLVRGQPVRVSSHDRLSTTSASQLGTQ